MDTIANPGRGMCAARLDLADYAANFSDSNPPLTHAQALIEAERCYYCFDAPCITACPTEIDVPSFIHRIAQDNNYGAARAILEANPLGGMCARVCPTEILCEQACVRNTYEDKPVQIGLLQRYATDAFFEHADRPMFERAPQTGRRVAVVGSGPAGLACAHGLAVQGHDVELFESKPKLGGLNEYGLASYKTTNDFAQKEVQWLLSVGGINVRSGYMLGRDITLDGLLATHDAVFLGLGLEGVNTLGVPEPPATGVRNAVDFIAELRQASHLSSLAVGQHVVVIGGGMTAVDAAVQARKLGARDVTIVYRRGAASMSASSVEQEWAQTNGVTIRHWAAPIDVLCEDGQVVDVTFATMAVRAGRLVHTDETFTLPADMVLKAIGQTYVHEPVGTGVMLCDGRIQVDPEGRTSVAGVWAGGDCVAGGRDLTVEAVQHGKVAARSIHRLLSVDELVAV